MARTEIPAPVHEAGDSLHGFRVEAVTSVPDIKARCYEVIHEKTGAQLLHVHADDEENLFSVGFVTLPEDSSGVAHILEHCVLAGSEKFPVKDAFNELGKRTLNTFLNAMTWPDRTVYPVCSAVPKDLRNLMEVYLDLVFHPKLSEQTFRQEGHHLELKEPGNLESPLVVSGVVYNEMHGVYSSPEAVVQRTLQRTLLPDSAYGVDSGGDPDRIPDLTWKALREFHSRYYHPSNARILLYGDIPLSEHLAFLDAELSRYDREPFDASARRQSRWGTPRTASIEYAVGEDEPTEGKTYVVVAWLLGDAENSEEALLLDVLAEALTGNSAGPLRKALIESGLGKDLFPGYLVRSGLRQVTAATGLRGTDPQHAEAIETLVLTTLRKIADEGLDPELIEAAFHQIEYAGKAIVPPFPIMLLVRAMPQWIYGGDPKRGLMFATDVEAARARYEANPRLFEELIERWLLLNAHRLLLTAAPSTTLSATQKAAREAGLAAQKDGLGEAELAAIDTEAQALTKAQRAPDPEEALATLPALAAEDIPTRVRHVPTKQATLAGRPLLQHEAFSNGIGYVGLAFDASDLPNDLTPYLPLLGKATLGMGAAGQPWTEVTRRIAATAGSMQLSPLSGRAVRGGDVHRGMALDGGALVRKAEPLAELMRDLLTASDLGDRKRLAEIVQERQSRLRSRLAPAGHRFAYQLAAASLSATKAFGEACDGISQLMFLNGLLAKGDAGLDDFEAKLYELQRLLFTKDRVLVSLAGDPEAIEALRDPIAAVLNALPAGEAGARVTPELRGSAPQGIVLPSEVNYCAQVIPVPGYESKAAPAFELLAEVLSNDHLYQAVRVEGGAYGGFCFYSPLDGIFPMLSYRDPNCEATFEAFDAALTVAEAGVTAKALEGSRLGAIGGFDRIISPGQQLSVARQRHFAGITRADREHYRQGLLSLTGDEVRTLSAEAIAAGRSSARRAAAGSRARLESAGPKLGTPFELLTLD